MSVWIDLPALSSFLLILLHSYFGVYLVNKISRCKIMVHYSWNSYIILGINYIIHTFPVVVGNYMRPFSFSGRTGPIFEPKQEDLIAREKTIQKQRIPEVVISARLLIHLFFQSTNLIRSTNPNWVQNRNKTHCKSRKADTWTSNIIRPGIFVVVRPRLQTGSGAVKWYTPGEVFSSHNLISNRFVSYKSVSYLWKNNRWWKHLLYSGNWLRGMISQTGPKRSSDWTSIKSTL